MKIVANSCLFTYLADTEQLVTNFVCHLVLGCVAFSELICWNSCPAVGVNRSNNIAERKTRWEKMLKCWDWQELQSRVMINCRLITWSNPLQIKPYPLLIKNIDYNCFKACRPTMYILMKKIPHSSFKWKVILAISCHPKSSTLRAFPTTACHVN